jgi:hypothetical protein
MSRNNNNKNREINELNELKIGNKKLINYLLFAKKCVKLLEKYRNFLTSLEICNKNIIDKKFVNCLENEFKTLFDSENNFNNKWIETKLKGLEIIDKNNEKLIEGKNKVIKTREDLKRSKLKNKSNIDYESCDQSIDNISINEESIDGKSNDEDYDTNEDFSESDSNYSSISDEKNQRKSLNKDVLKQKIINGKVLEEIDPNFELITRNYIII